MSQRQVIGYATVFAAVRQVADQWRSLARSSDLVGVYGVPRGGCVPAALVAQELGLPLVDEPSYATLVIDDLVDSGRTAARYQGLPFDALFYKSQAPLRGSGVAVGDAWVVFPWEVGTLDEAGPADAVVRLLEFVGEDPARPGLIDTPGRVLRALAEMTAGYREDPAALLATTFPDDYDEMVVVSGIEFSSLCEHHLLGFTGTAAVGYVPNGGGVVGLSKLARLVELYARRLQVQERMTKQIAAAIQEHLDPLGVGVVVRARHSCMACRGVRKPGAEMVTSALLGVFRDKPEARAEFLALARTS